MELCSSFALFSYWGHFRALSDPLKHRKSVGGEGEGERRLRQFRHHCSHFLSDFLHAVMSCWSMNNHFEYDFIIVLSKNYVTDLAKCYVDVTHIFIFWLGESIKLTKVFAFNVPHRSIRPFLFDAKGQKLTEFAFWMCDLTFARPNTRCNDRWPHHAPQEKNERVENVL